MPKDVYECDRCEMQFDTNAELQEHRRLVHGREIEAEIDEARKEVRRLDRM